MNIGPCNKRGIFEVNDQFFNGLCVGDGVNLFSGMVILDMRRDYLQGYREYCAIHADFRPVQIGEITPKYQGVFSTGSTIPKWVEVIA